jgi:hypothetical protein
MAKHRITTLGVTYLKSACKTNKNEKIPSITLYKSHIADNNSCVSTTQTWIKFFRYVLHIAISLKSEESIDGYVEHM